MVCNETILRRSGIPEPIMASFLSHQAVFHATNTEALTKRTKGKNSRESCSKPCKRQLKINSRQTSKRSTTVQTSKSHRKWRCC